MDFTASKCRGSWLHQSTIIAVHPEVIYEQCQRCGKKHIIKLYRGNPNAVDYARFHMREFLIPQHRLFKKEFPQHA